jgi:hypothetical protein
VAIARALVHDPKLIVAGRTVRIPMRTRLAEKASMCVQAILWLAVRPFGHMRSDPFQKKFADQIRYSIRTRARQTIEND